MQGLRAAHAESAPAGTRPLPPPPPPPPPRGRVASPAGAKPGSSLESRIGAQLLNRIGILAVLIGMAWFLKLAFDRNWIGPGIRILIGLACAAALVVWSERFRRRGFPAFSYSLKALGTSIAYLSLWAASSVYHLAPNWLIFLAMTAVTIANAVLARRQKSELLAMYALAGGLATPALLAMGHDSALLSLLLPGAAEWGRVVIAGAAPMEAAGLGCFAGNGGLLHWLDSERGRSLSLAGHGVFSGSLFCRFCRGAFPDPAPGQAPDPLFPVAFPIANARRRGWG